MNRPVDLSSVTVVTIASGRHDHLDRQLTLLARFSPGAQHVVVAMDDASIREVVGNRADVVSLDRVDGRLPLAAARNLGVSLALQAGPRLLLLLDVDCVVAPSALQHYLRASAEAPNALLAGPVTYLAQGVTPPPDLTKLAELRNPHPARPAPPPGTLIRHADHNLFWSLNFAVTPQVWERIGGFCLDYNGYGAEDTDFAWQARSEGIEFVWVGGADAYHQHHPVSSPPVEHTADIVRNAVIFQRRWGSWPMGGWLESLEALGHITWRDGSPRLVEQW